MQRTIERSRRRPGGFTMVEILVVITIIAALIALSISVYGNLMESARRTATLTTISKADKLLQQQITAWNREYRDSTEVRQTAQDPRITGLVSGTHAQQALAVKLYFRQHFPQNVGEVSGFDGDPCTPTDNQSTYSAWLTANWDCTANDLVNPEQNLPTISSELLYLALTQGKVRGSAPVDADSFRGKELADTDGDGFLELVDGWGNPLRFYRWPTRLLHPFGFIGETLTSNLAAAAPGSTVSITVDAPRSGMLQIHEVLSNLRGANSTAKVFIVIGREIMEVIPPSSSGSLTVVRGSQSTDAEPHIPGAVVQLAAFPDVLSLVFGSLNSSAVAHDADDPRGDILSSMTAATTPDDIELFVHTLDSFHTPLIVSAGSDGELGLIEAFFGGTSGFNFGNLAVPDTRDLTVAANHDTDLFNDVYGGDFSIIADPLNSTLNDNLTNQMEGLGN